MQNKFKKILILFLLLLTTLNLAHSADEKKEKYDMKILHEGFCPNLPVEFKIYNQSQYKDKERIEKRLCEDDEKPDEDHCTEWVEFDLEITSYSGPIDGLPILTSKKMSNIREFSLTFPSQNRYLIKIKPYGDSDDDYNEIEYYVDIDECKFSKFSNNDNSDNSNQNTNKNLKNQTFQINSQTTIKIENTEIKKKEDITIQEINPTQNNLPSLENQIQTLEIDLKNFQKTKIEILTQLDTPDISKTKIYKLNSNTNTWELITENPTIYQNQIQLEITDNGIYSFQSEKPKETTIDVNPTEPNNSENNSNTETNTPTNNNNNNNEDSNQPIQLDLDKAKTEINYKIVILVGIIIISILSFLFIPKFKKKEYFNYNQNKPINNEIYTKTKQYVQKYKTKYSKEQIKQSLTQGKIDQDTIEKVLKEEFPENNNTSNLNK